MTAIQPTCQASVSSIDKRLTAAFEKLVPVMQDPRKCYRKLTLYRNAALGYFEQPEAYSAFLEIFTDVLERTSNHILTEKGILLITPETIKNCTRYAFEETEAILEGRIPEEIPFSALERKASKIKIGQANLDYHGPGYNN